MPQIYIFAMLILVRDRDYLELLVDLTGKKVYVWTCDTCARLCNSVGGRKSAEALAERLSGDGVEIVGLGTTSASCIMSKLERVADEVFSKDPDVVLSLTCDAGAACAASVFGRDTVNPVDTLGYGYLSQDGVPVLLSDLSGKRFTKGTDGSSPFTE